MIAFSWVFIILTAICLAAGIATIFLGNKAARLRKKVVKKAQAEYMDKTLPCPACFGRGRIARPGWKFADDTPEKEFIDEMKVVNIPYVIREAMDEDKKR